MPVKVSVPQAEREQGDANRLSGVHPVLRGQRYMQAGCDQDRPA
jgi:hypothetical protein